MNEIDVFVGNNCVISPEIYELWLKGYTGKTRGHNTIV